MAMSEAAVTVINRATRSSAGHAIRRVLHHPGLLIGAFILVAIVIVSVFAPWLAPDDPYRQDLYQRITPPIWHAQGTWAHPLGTDGLGRDYLTRIMYGGRIALLIGFGVVAIAGVIGSVLGVMAGFFGGRTDLVISFLLSMRLSMPVILVALAVVALVGSSIEIVICVLGLLLWDRFAVVMRSATMQIRDLDYIKAARACGCSTWRILFSELLPNVMNSLIVVASIEMSHAILLEASLSFLGLGVQPPLPSWGLTMAEARQLMFFDPWVITVPGVALFLLVLSIALVGDGIRDITAPENRG